MSAELLPTRASYGTGDSVSIEVLGEPAVGEVIVRRLGDEVLRLTYDGSGPIVLAWLPAGCYGIELVGDHGSIRTAIEVVETPGARLRYGFVASYLPDRDVAGAARLARRLHLTDIQFYDWAYRHADLLGGGEDYSDALDQPIALETVRRLIAAFHNVGARALGYAAVYAVGPEEWPQWKHLALETATGEPYGLGDFLFLLDPASPEWLASFTGQLESATAEVGFDGFHLDQYGYPKRATRADGAQVDVAASFTALIERARDVLPQSRLVFNNVNDFPTWVTARLRQDAVYIEVWNPTLTLSALAAVVNRARAIAPKLPTVIAAYQHVYDSAPAASSDLATAFTMATLFSHGATQLLAGEADRILVDPYYVRNHVVEESTAALLKRWYDFLVEHDALLLAPELVDVTASYVSEYNDDCDVSFGGLEVREAAEAGTIWRRVTTDGSRLVVHLINLTGQSDTLWDAPRQTPGATGDGVLRFRRTGPGTPRVRAADPDAAGRLIDIPVTLDGTHATATIPAFGVWQVILIDTEGETGAAHE